MESVKEEIYHAQFFQIPVTIYNYTIHKTITQPRRSYSVIQSSKIFLSNSKTKILSLSRHWRVGEIPSELNWLNDPVQLKRLFIDDCLSRFKLYIFDIESFINENEKIWFALKDKWCQENTFEESIEDFLISYNSIFISNLQPNDISYITNTLKDNWKFTFQSELDLENLVRSGFLKCDFPIHFHLDGYGQRF